MTVGPVVVGGVGGSGTRVVARILLELGHDLGNDLNRHLDDLWFNLLFYRPAWVRTAATGSTGDVPIGLDLMYKRAYGPRRLTARELGFLRRAWRDVVRDGHFGARGRGRRARAATSWTTRRVARFLSSGRHERGSGTARWGWKEPLTHVFAGDLLAHDPGARYVHVVRHGLDMAFSANRRQVRRFASLYGLEAPSRPPTPADMLRFWVRANRVILDQLQPTVPDRVHVVCFDDLCRAPGPEIERLIEFLGLDVGRRLMRELREIPRPPRSMGRHGSHDLSLLDLADVGEVERLGFAV